MFGAVLGILMVAAYLFAFYQKKTNGVCRSKVRLVGKVAIVTGGTSGIGLQIALDLARRGAKVIIAGPFPDEGEAALHKIITQTGNQDIVYELLDLASLKSTRKFADKISKTETKLDILINNAGVAGVGDFMTDDGLNFVMQVNYFGHFLLTMLLLPLLKNAGKGRIVNQCSWMHMLGSIDLEHLNSRGYYYPIQLYSNSKLCLILFSKELTKRLKTIDVVINNVDPGAVGTRIFEGLGHVLLGKLIAYLHCVFMKKPSEGAQTAIYAAIDERINVSGEFFKDCRLSKARHKQAFDDEMSMKLWEESRKLVQLQDYEYKF